jgi:hypothetical protein
MKYEEIVKAIDEDIEKHHQKASGMLGVVESVLTFGVIALLLYFVPSMAEKALPSIQAEAGQEKSKYEEAVRDFEGRYSKKFYSVSEDEYETLTENNAVTDAVREARTITKMNDGESKVLSLVAFVSALKIDDGKIEFVLKLLPYVIGAVLAGFLVTYRLHVVSAKELAIKKIELLERAQSGNSTNE